MYDLCIFNRFLAIYENCVSWSYDFCTLSYLCFHELPEICDKHRYRHFRGDVDAKYVIRWVQVVSMSRVISSMCHFKASCGSTSWYLVTWSLIIIPQSETVHTKCHIMLIFSLVIMPVIVITFVWRSLHRIYWFAVFIYKATRTPKAPGVMLHAILEHYFKQLSHSSVCYRWKEYSVLRHVKNKTEIEK